MIRNLLHTRSGPSLTWESIVGDSYVLTYEDTTTTNGTTVTNPTTPVSGNAYTNLAKVTPTQRGVAIAKWVLSDDSIGFYGSVFISEIDIIAQIVESLSISEYAAEQLCIKTYNSVRSVLAQIHCNYTTLSDYGAVLFDSAFFNYIVATQTTVGTGQQVQALESDNDKIRFFENKRLTDQSFSPLDEFIESILAIPEVAALNESTDAVTFTLAGVRRTEAETLDNRDGTTNVISLIEDDLS